MNKINVPSLIPRLVSLKLVVLVPPEYLHGVGKCCFIFVAGFLCGA